MTGFIGLASEEKTIPSLDVGARLVYFFPDCQRPLVKGFSLRKLASFVVKLREAVEAGSQMWMF
jgi:hypothetical protein